MLLGEVIERLSDEAFAAEAMLTLGNLPLLVEVEAAGRRFGESASTYAAAAVRQFVNHASDDDWLALTGALGRGGDPGATCLRQMLAWSLHRDSAPTACGCSSNDSSGEQDA